MQEEIWEDVVGFEGFYQVSNIGRVKSIERYVNAPVKGYNSLKNSKMLKPGVNTSGYLHVALYKYNIKSYHKVHRLVAKAFIENIENKSDVNHKDGNKLNNNINNLEWNTHLENMQHAKKNGLVRKKVII